MKKLTISVLLLTLLGTSMASEDLCGSEKVIITNYKVYGGLFTSKE